MSTQSVDLQLPRLVLQGKNLNFYLATGLILLAVWWFKRRKQPSVDVPFYKASIFRWMFDAETLVRESYQKYRDTVYMIKATEGPQVLIPANLVGELKGLPEEILSATEAVSEALQSKYTNLSAGPDGDVLSTLVRTKLSHNLSRLIPQLKDELEFITATEFPDCKDWTPVKFQPFALRAIARLSGRVFVGPEINRREEWMDTSINFAVHVFLAVVKLQFFPEWLRPVGQYLVSELRQIRRDMETAQALLRPIIEERLRDMEMPSFEKRSDDLIQWIIDALPAEEKHDIAVQTKIQLTLAAASIHTTNNLLTDCMYDLAARPDVQEILREEVYEVLEQDNGWGSKDGMSRMKKMDSFMKEVQRMSGNITSFIRKVIKPIDLSDGTHLPAGTKLLMPQTGISRDARYFPDPDAFDFLRFHKLRQQSGDEANRHQFTSISDTNLNFGAGRHACPGRFFAGNEIKMALSYFLLNYDVKLQNGTTRPKSMAIIMSKAPDPKIELLFRRRTVA